MLPAVLNPDNSLASLAATLKEAGYKPLIIDYQTLSYCQHFLPEEFGKRLVDQLGEIKKSPNDHKALDKFKELNKELLQHQLSVVDEIADDLIKKAKKEKPLFIGLKLYSGDCTHFCSHLVKRIKEKLSVPILGGGPGYSSRWQKLFRALPRVRLPHRWGSRPIYRTTGPLSTGV